VRYEKWNGEGRYREIQGKIYVNEGGKEKTCKV
jgi:hypothetical protein